MKSTFLKPWFKLADVQPADIDRLAEIHTASFASPWTADEIATLLGAGRVLCLAGRPDGLRDGQPLAGFVLTRSAADEAEILTLAVDPAWRSRGLARALVEEAMRRLYREGTAALFLEVDEGNVPARLLYHRLGFEQIGERKGYYRDAAGGPATALVMRVQLR